MPCTSLTCEQSSCACAFQKFGIKVKTAFHIPSNLSRLERTFISGHCKISLHAPVRRHHISAPMVSSNMLPTSNIGQLSFIVLGFLVLVYVGNAVRVWYRLRHFKGPISVAFSKFWIIRSHLQQRVYLDVGEACEKYGE